MVHKDSLVFTSSPTLSLTFFIIAILTGMGSFLIVVLICIFLMISDAEHLLMCLLAIRTSSLERSVYSNPLPIFNWIISLFAIELCEFLIYFLYYPLIWYMVCIFFFILWPVDIQFSHQLLKWLPFPHWVFLALMSNTSRSESHGFIFRLLILFRWYVYLFCASTTLFW